MRARPTVRAAMARLAPLVAALLLACGPRGPRPLAYDGSESCDYCRMAITDARYGAELVTRTGKTHAFDSIECLASYYTQAARDEATPPTAWVSDFTRPGTFVRVDSARFLRTTGARGSPMGLGLLAVGPGADVAALQRQVGGTPLDWAGVLALVGKEGATLHGAGGSHAPGH